jgi:HSP20 family protein
MSNLSIWSDNATANQWRGLMDLQRNLDLVFDRAFGNVKIDPWDDETVFHPAVDMEETDSHYVMNVDLPGVSKKDIQVEFKDNELHISAKRKNEKKTSAYSERYYGKFHRVFTVPSGIDTEKIEAQYQDGVLSLAVPKSESAKPRQIKITDGKSSFFGKLLGGNKETEKEQKTISGTTQAA